MGVDLEKGKHIVLALTRLKEPQKIQNAVKKVIKDTKLIKNDRVVNVVVR